jgi:hypothetical protein
MSKWAEEQDNNDWEEEADWDEDRWEEFFQEQDRRADYYTKKFEQSLKKYESAGSPDPIEDAFNDLFPTLDNSSASEETNEIDELLSETEAESNYEETKPAWAQDETTEEFDDFRKIYAYQVAFEFGIAIHHFVEPIFKTPIKAPALHQLHYHGFQVEAHIAGGHAYGYERDGIIANIAKCKRALKNINSCIEAIAKIKQYKIAPPGQTEALFQQAINVRDAVIHWIEELRAMVWW